MTTTTQKVINYLKNRKTAVNAKTIATRTGINYNTLRRILGELNLFTGYDKNGYATYTFK